MEYPSVFGEFETIAAVRKGRSLSRLGDGEFGIAFGSGYCREPKNARLTEEVRSVLLTPTQNCLVGIPTMDPAGDRYWNWSRHKDRYAALLQGRRGKLYSAFIGRPECAQWIDNKGYVQAVADLWKDKHVAVVCEAEGSILKALYYGARKIDHIECLFREAYSEIDAYERAVAELNPEIAILCAGPTATCLANRLQRRGIQAVDLGSAGKFLTRWLAS